jgi:hypothetical protein
MELHKETSIHISEEKALPGETLAFIQGLYEGNKRIPKHVSGKARPLSEKKSPYAEISLDKDFYAPGSLVTGQLRLSLEEAVRNSLTVRVKGFAIFNTRNEPAVTPGAEKIVCFLQEKHEGCEVVKFLEGEQVLSYVDVDNAVPDMILGSKEVDFEFELLTRIPTSMQTQMQRAKLRVTFFIEAELEEVLLFKEFRIALNQFDYFDKKAVSRIQISVSELLCCHLGTFRIEVLVEQVQLKKGEALPLTLQFSKDNDVEPYVPEKLRLELWMRLQGTRVLDEMDALISTAGVVNVFTINVELESVEFENDTLTKNIKLKITKDLPSSEDNSLFELNYFIIVRPGETSETIDLVSESVKLFPLYFL